MGLWTWSQGAGGQGARPASHLAELRYTETSGERRLYDGAEPWDAGSDGQGTVKTGDVRTADLAAR